MFKYSVIFALFAACCVDCYTTSSCKQQKHSMVYLDIATRMIAKMKDNFPVCMECNEILPEKAMDCADLLYMGQNKSGVYKIWPMNRLTRNKPVSVYCDMETNGGGWTVIQRRGDFGNPYDYFYKDWKNYKEGFGELVQDFWLGNDNIFALTNQNLYSVRFDLRDVKKEKRYAQYENFWIDDENHKYTLHISGYSGDAGDSMTYSEDDTRFRKPEFEDEFSGDGDYPMITLDVNGRFYKDNQKFSTRDQENDNQSYQNCARLYKGAWWYNSCHMSNLNGLYLKGKQDSFADGVNWNSWKGYYESLEWTEIKIRPQNFKYAYDFKMTAA